MREADDVAAEIYAYKRKRDAAAFNRDHATVLHGLRAHKRRAGL